MSTDALSQTSRIISSIATIGNKVTDTDKEKLQHRFLVYMGLLMSGGGILWGTISVYFDLWLPSILPYGYTMLTFINFTFFPGVIGLLLPGRSAAFDPLFRGIDD